VRDLRPSLHIPPGVDIQKNIAEAKTMSLWEFYNAVKDGGKWDYKGLGKQYENFGNYHFGVIGRAFGFKAGILRRGAGAYQVYFTNNSEKEWGKPWQDAPYGDDPKDQIWINKGINDFNNSQFDMK